MDVVTSDSMVREYGTAWWVMVIQGIAALVVGVLLLTQPGATLLTIVVLVGVYWFVLGIIELVRMFSDPAGWGWKLLSGVLGILAGLVLIRHPLWSAVFTTSLLVWVVGFLGLLIGLVSIIRGIAGAGWGAALSGLAAILLGLLLLFHTATTVAVVVYTAGIITVIAGLAGIVGGIALRARGGSGAKRVAY
jgi:uncharacterized membrane protein HdeD (DUF308 family)